MNLNQFELGVLVSSVVAACIACYRVGRRARRHNEAPRTVVTQLQKRIAMLRDELAVERMKVVVCGMALTQIGERLPDTHPNWSPSYADICRYVDKVRARKL
jgi:hypothetical protein